MSEQTRWTLAKANELALMSSERIRRSLELLGPRRRAAIRNPESAHAVGARLGTSARRSAPPPSGA
jgi:hypothetical protein